MKLTGAIGRWGMPALTVALLLCASACTEQNACQSTEQKAIKALVMAKAHSLSMSLSALREIRRNDPEVAISTLEGELQSALVILYALLPAFSGDREFADEILRDAERYAADHGLELVRPAGVK